MLFSMSFKCLWWSLSLVVSDLGFPMALLVQVCWAAGGENMRKEEKVCQRKDMHSPRNREVVCGLWMMLRPRACREAGRRSDRRGPPTGLLSRQVAFNPSVYPEPQCFTSINSVSPTPVEHSTKSQNHAGRRGHGEEA